VNANANANDAGNGNGDGSGSEGGGGDDVNWVAILTPWQRQKMEEKLLSMADVLHTLGKLWGQHIDDCKRLPVGARQPQQPSLLRAHRVTNEDWGGARKLVVRRLPTYQAVSRWVQRWTEHGVIERPKNKGPQGGQTWYVAGVNDV
jgi:hypothetical protein